jgi:hypothetical protein
MMNILEKESDSPLRLLVTLGVKELTFIGQKQLIKISWM